MRSVSHAERSDQAATGMVVGWNEFVKGFDFWMDPRFKANSVDIRELRIDLSRSGDVAWWPCGSGRHRRSRILRPSGRATSCGASAEPRPRWRRSGSVADSQTGQAMSWPQHIGDLIMP